MDVVSQSQAFTIGTELMKNVEEEVNFEGGQFYNFSGFIVSTDVGSLLHTSFDTMLLFRY